MKRREQKIILKYSLGFKHKVIGEIEAGKMGQKWGQVATFATLNI